MRDFHIETVNIAICTTQKQETIHAVTATRRGFATDTLGTTVSRTASDVASPNEILTARHAEMKSVNICLMRLTPS